MALDEAGRISLRSDINLFLGTRGRGQWFSSDQLYAALGMGARQPTLSPPEFRAFLHELAERKVIERWRSGSEEMFGIT